MTTGARIASVLVAGVIVLSAVAVYMTAGDIEWRAELDTTQLSEGWHTITAVATDEAGNEGTDTIQVYVDNLADTTATIVPSRRDCFLERTTASVKLLVKLTGTDVPQAMRLYRRNIGGDWVLLKSEMKWYPISKTYQYASTPSRTTAYKAVFLGTPTIEPAESALTTITVWSEVK